MKYGRRNPYFIIAGRQTQGALRSGAGHRSDRDFCSSRIGGNLQSNSPAADDPPYGSTADRYAGSDGGHRDWPFPQGRGFGGSCGGAGNLRELGAATLGSLVHCLRRLLKLLVTRIASRDGFRARDYCAQPRVIRCALYALRQRRDFGKGLLAGLLAQSRLPVFLNTLSRNDQNLRAGVLLERRVERLERFVK